MNIFQELKLLKQLHNLINQIQKGQPMKWIPTLVTFVLSIIGMSDSAIQTFVSHHPMSAVIFAAVYAIVKGLLASPLGQGVPAPSAKTVAMILFVCLIVSSAHAQAPDAPLPQNVYAAGVSTTTVLVLPSLVLPCTHAWLMMEAVLMRSLWWMHFPRQFTPSPSIRILGLVLPKRSSQSAKLPSLCLPVLGSRSMEPTPDGLGLQALSPQCQ